MMWEHSAGTSVKWTLGMDPASRRPELVSLLLWIKGMAVWICHDHSDIPFLNCAGAAGLYRLSGIQLSFGVGVLGVRR